MPQDIADAASGEDENYGIPEFDCLKSGVPFKSRTARACGRARQHHGQSAEVLDRHERTVSAIAAADSLGRVQRLLYRMLPARINPRVPAREGTSGKHLPCLVGGSNELAVIILMLSAELSAAAVFRVLACSE